MRRRTLRRGGFTLMEVLLVLVILVVLGSLAVPMLSQTRNRANEDNAKIQVNTISNAVENFYIDMNRYPTADEGVDALISAPSSSSSTASKWRGPYLKKIPLDPWGNAYKINPDGSHQNQNGPTSPDVYSMGPDGQDGTDDDIGNWDENQS